MFSPLKNFSDMAGLFDNLTYGKAMGIGVAGSAVNGLFGFLGNMYNNAQYKKMYEQQYRDSLDFYKMQMDDQWRMWNANNAYNTPSAQAARMRAAGINPDLAYSQIDTGNSGSAPSVPTPNLPVQQYTPLSAEVFSIMPNILETIERIQNIDANELSISEQVDDDVIRTLLGTLTDEDIQSLKDNRFDFRILGTDFWSKIPGLSRRRARFYAERAYNMMRSPEFFERYNRAKLGDTDSMFELQKILGNPRYDKSGEVNKILSDFLQLVNSTDMAILRSRRSEARYQSDYNEQLDPDIAASQQNVSRDYAKEEKEFEKKFFDYLNADKDDTTAVGRAIRQFLGGLYLILSRMNGLGPSFSKSSSTGPMGNTHSTSIGF